MLAELQICKNLSICWRCQYIEKSNNCKWISQIHHQITESDDMAK